MLDKILHKHIDRMEEIEAEMQSEIDSIISSIDKELLVTDPQSAMQEVADEIAILLEEKYMPMAAQVGVDLSKIIDKGKDIVIDPSKDSTKNAEIL